MLRKGDRAPFIVRTILVMTAVYFSLMLAATWCVKTVLRSGGGAGQWTDTIASLKLFYVLAMLIVITLTAILIATHNSLIEDKFESERKRRLMTDSMAHDMKTPLSIIRNYGELLLGSETSEKREEYARTIIDESDRMNEAVVSLLDLSKMEAGTYPMDLNDFHIRDVIEETVRRYRVLFEKKNMTAVIDSPENLRMFADRKLITRALSNFISNGIRNGNPGTQMIISAKKLSGAIRIQVHNSGQYLDEDAMKNIWEAYYQRLPGDDKDADTARRSSENTGSGLGLAIVRNICLLHGGGYGCENDGDGVTFWMQISSQEGRLGKMDVLTGPVTGVAGSVNPVKGMGFIALGTLIQGLFWTLYFYGSFMSLIPCLFDPGAVKETLITDTVGLAAAGIGAGFILYGTILLGKLGWQVRNNVIVDICQLIIIGLTMVLLIAIIFLGGRYEAVSDTLNIICLILEAAVSTSMAVILLIHFRIMSEIAKQLGMFRRSRKLQGQMLLMTFILVLFTGVSLSGIAVNLPYSFMGSIWFLICIASSMLWITTSRGMITYDEETPEFGQYQKMAGRAYTGVAISIILTEIAFFGWQSHGDPTALMFTVTFAVSAVICFVLTLRFNRLENRTREQQNTKEKL